MTNIIGSIDNAGVWNTTYHLIFTDDCILQFMTISAKDRRSDLFNAQMSNSMRMVPIAGTISNYSVTKQEVIDLINESERIGKQIEENLNEHLTKNPPDYTRIPYNEVISVQLSDGTPVTLPHVIFETERGKIKFHLLHSNFQGRGKLPDDVFSRYRETLTRAFGTKLKVK